MGLVNRVVPPGRGRDEAEALGRQLAKFPQRAMLGDRRSAYEQWELPLTAALANELERGTPALAEAMSGAARFQRGAGRHGSFDD